MLINGITIKGIDVDPETRCAHYHTKKDIIAIKFACCQTYYPCYQCHDQLVNHERTVWQKEQYDSKAVLCGVCGTELTIQQYFSSASTCPDCSSVFNEGCINHYHLYFATDTLTK